MSKWTLKEKTFFNYLVCEESTIWSFDLIPLDSHLDLLNVLHVIPRDVESKSS